VRALRSRTQSTFTAIPDRQAPGTGLAEPQWVTLTLGGRSREGRVRGLYAQLRTIAIDEPRARLAGDLGAEHGLRGYEALTSRANDRQAHRQRDGLSRTPEARRVLLRLR
jgi:hypothetical protein